MAVIPVNQTEANLLRAFARETLGSRRYQAFEARSEAEGHDHAAVVLRHLAQLRARHAEEHLRMLDGFESALTDHSTDDTKSDLRVARASELKRSALYDGMAITARHEGFNEIADWFEMLAKNCRSYAGRFQRALETLTERGFGEISQ